MWRQSPRLRTARGETSADGADAIPGHLSFRFGLRGGRERRASNRSGSRATDVDISAGPTGNRRQQCFGGRLVLNAPPGPGPRRGGVGGPFFQLVNARYERAR